MGNYRATAHAVIGEIKYLTTIEANGKTIVSDEPLDHGGGDQGFAPFQLLLASLGACTAITLKMYVARKEWEVGSIEIELSLITLSDQSNLIERNIRFKGNPTEEQKKRLLQIADVCPVHKLLTGKVTIETHDGDDNKQEAIGS